MNICFCFKKATTTKKQLLLRSGPTRERQRERERERKKEREKERERERQRDR